MNGWSEDDLVRYNTGRNNPKDNEPPIIKCPRCGATMINACRVPCPNCGYMMECG